MSAAFQRFSIVARRIFWVSIGLGCGFALVYLTSFAIPIGVAVHASHGMVGFIYGAIIAGGFFAANVMLWVVTGESIFDRMDL